MSRQFSRADRENVLQSDDIIVLNRGLRGGHVFGRQYAILDDNIERLTFNKNFIFLYFFYVLPPRLLLYQWEQL